MPDVKIMTWNIQTLGETRANVDELVTTLAQVIVSVEPDICLIQELSGAGSTEALGKLATACEVLAANAGATHQYEAWLISQPDGVERMGVIVRDLDRVRPMQYQPANAEAPVGSQNQPLRSAQQGGWTSWPAAFGNNVQYPLQNRPNLPLVTSYFRSSVNDNRWRDFGGMSGAAGGFAEGRGSRLPMMAVFEIAGNAGSYYLPVITVHAAAGDRSRTNQLTRDHMKHLRELHLCQLYDRAEIGNEADLMRYSGYLYLNGGWRSVANLLLAGDFNIDFAMLARAPQAEQRAWTTVTPTAWEGGSHEPTSLPGDLLQPAPNGAPPANGVAPAWMNNFDEDYKLTLKVANTTALTHLNTYDERNNYTLDNIMNACFDNLFFGGTEADEAPLQNNNDAGSVIDIPRRLFPSNDNVVYHPISLIRSYQIQEKYNADKITPLRANGGIADAKTRLIVARMISDHLPVVMTIPFP